MSQIAVTIIMTGAALVALVLLVQSLRQARAEGDLDASAALTLGMAWLIALPIALVAISGGLTRRQDVFREFIAVFPDWYGRAVDLTVLLVAALAAVLLLRQLTAARIPVHTAGLLAILLWAVAQASGFHGGRPLLVRDGVLLVCLMAATVLPRGRGACLGAGIFGVTLAIASGLLALFRYDVAFVVPCENACGGLGFTGVLPNPDLLGIALAASIPFAYLGFRGRARYWFALYLAGMAIATGSRTASLAAVITVVALLIVRPRVDADRSTAGRAAVAGLVLAGAVLSSVYIVRHDWEASDLTNRPVLWRVASEYVQESPWFGYGPHRWASLAESGEIPLAAQRSAHNQWMDILFVAGWTGAALLVGMAVAMLWSSGLARPGVVVALATITMIGTTEGAWSVGTIDLLSFSLIALILTGATGDKATLSRAIPAHTPGTRAPVSPATRRRDGRDRRSSRGFLRDPAEMVRRASPPS